MERAEEAIVGERRRGRLLRHYFLISFVLLLVINVVITAVGYQFVVPKGL